MTPQVTTQVARVIEAARSDCSLADLQAAAGLKDRVHFLKTHLEPLIFRSACSMIVAKDGGTPLILDDALGYTDPERLRLMGAVLAKAAKECQIVIFTCVPDRYGNVGEATVVAIG